MKNRTFTFYQISETAPHLSPEKSYEVETSEKYTESMSAPVLLNLKKHGNYGIPADFNKDSLHTAVYTKYTDCRGTIFTWNIRNTDLFIPVVPSDEWAYA